MEMTVMRKWFGVCVYSEQHALYEIGLQKKYSHSEAMNWHTNTKPHVLSRVPSEIIGPETFEVLLYATETGKKTADSSAGTVTTLRQSKRRKRCSISDRDKKCFSPSLYP